VIIDTTVEWRFAGDRTWRDVDTMDIAKNFTLYPMQNSELSYLVTINGMLLSFYLFLFLFLFIML
jgi:hypothetical protein